MNPASKSVCIVMMFLICSCGTPAIITSSWHKTDVAPNSYPNIFIAAVTNQIGDKQTIEDDIQQILQQKGLTVEKSIDLFPPKIGAAKRQVVAISKVRSTGADGILTITLLRKEKEPHFEALPAWDPVGDDYVNRYADQFIDGYPYKFDYDGYYKDDIVYYVETDFYSTKSEQLIWSAQSKTYDPNNLNGFVKGYIQTIYQQMIKDGVIASANVKL